MTVDHPAGPEPHDQGDRAGDRHPQRRAARRFPSRLPTSPTGFSAGGSAAALAALRAKGHEGEVVQIPVPGDAGVDVIVAVGLGRPPAGPDGLDPEAVRRAVAIAVRTLAGPRRRPSCRIGGPDVGRRLDTAATDEAALVGAIAEGAALGAYAYHQYKTGTGHGAGGPGPDPGGGVGREPGRAGPGRGDQHRRDHRARLGQPGAGRPLPAVVRRAGDDVRPRGRLHRAGARRTRAAPGKLRRRARGRRGFGPPAPSDPGELPAGTGPDQRRAGRQGHHLRQRRLQPQGAAVAGP